VRALTSTTLTGSRSDFQAFLHFHGTLLPSMLVEGRVCRLLLCSDPVAVMSDEHSDELLLRIERVSSEEVDYAVNVGPLIG
jgi:hypothetical protein